MPSENEPLTLYDDFIERAKNTFRPEFIENVNNPSLLCDFLKCLEEIDREVVKAQQTQYGAMHAAGILFDRVIKRPDWLDDLTKALKDPQIGLDFLAERLHRFEGTIPIKWDLSSFTDEYGKACFNGNCSDINHEVIEAQRNQEPDNYGVQETSSQQEKEAPTQENSPVVQETILAQPESTESPIQKVQVSEQTQAFDDVDNSCETRTDNAHEVTPRPQAMGIPPQRPERSEISVEERRTEIELERESLRNKFMEKIYSCIKNPEDIPIALHYLKDTNIIFDSISKGSIIISIYIGCLDALQSFEKLWRYGGLKKMLDKEMLGEDMVKCLKAVAVENGHPVDNIKSELKVFETDIERCRSSLLKTSYDFHPRSFAELTMVTDKSKTSRESRDIAMHAMERLPDELKSLFEDPFIFDRATCFFESESLKERLRSVVKEMPGSSQMKSVSQIFIEWLNSELEKYLKELDDVTLRHLIVLAVYLVQSFDDDGVVAIAQEVLSENAIIKERKMIFPSDSTNHGFWGDLVELPREVAVNKEVLQEACMHLMDQKVINRSRGSLNFLSDVVRDAFVAKVILRCRSEGGIMAITDSFSYVQTLMGLFQMGNRYGVNDEMKSEALSCSFKTDELREIGISGEHNLTISSGSSYYSSDLVLCRNGEISLDTNIVQAGEIIRKCHLEVQTKTHSGLVDFSQPLTKAFFVLEDGLHWLNAAANGRIFEKNVSGLSFNNRTITEQHLCSIGSYLNVSPSMNEISLKNCLQSASVLQQSLQMGHFRNIRHLDVSDNALFEKTPRQIGLMYATSLKNLEVQNCSIGDEGMRYLALDLRNMGHLRQLNVANNRLSARGILSLTKALGDNKSLAGLRIHKNYIGKDGSTILASWLESLILLEVLNISECGISDKGSLVIASALVSRSLRKLSMRKNELTARGSRDFFKNFQRPPYLEHLDFSENKVLSPSDRSSLSVAEDLSPTATEEPFREFLENVQAMSHLSLWNTCLGQKRIFSGLGHHICFEEMTYLCLQENSLSDDFVLDVADCIKQPRCLYLQHLNLRQNHIGNNGAKCIAQAIAGKEYLKDILLDRNEIGDEGAKKIVSSCIDLTSFGHLDLSCNNISRMMIVSIIEDLVNDVKVQVGSGNTGTTSGGRHIVQKQTSYDETSFTISKDVDKYLIIA